MNKTYSIRFLTEEFYKKYNEEDYPEIEHKDTRPYLVLLLTIEDNTFALPFRTNIRHNYCYKFHNTGRDTDSVTGIDYTKAVIVNDDSFLGNDANIDDKEYVELNGKYFFIIKQFTNYLNGYKKYVAGELNPYAAKKYLYSTLRYFHKELGL